MICPDCGHDNIEGVDVCDECGQSLVQCEPTGGELTESISRHSIKVLCPNPPITVGSGTTVRDAIRKMITNRIGCLLIVEEDVLAGIFTERDVLNRVSSDAGSLDRPVSEFMTPHAESVTSEDSIAYALHSMDLGGYRHLPIVDTDGRPGGIISVRDILRFLCVRFARSRSPA